MPSDPTDDPLLIPAGLSPGEAQDHRARLLGLVADGATAIDFSETADCAHPTAIALQLCLATAAELRAAGRTPVFGAEARRLLSAQNLL